MCPCHSWLLLRFLGGSRNLTVRKCMSVMDGLWSPYYLKACLHIFVFSDLGVHVLHPVSFANELHSWLQEIDRKWSETMATCISVEKLCKDNKSLIAENEKMKVISQPKVIWICAHLESSQSVWATYSLPAMSFAGGEPQSAELYRRAKYEVNKLFGQQNLQQRIHNHTRIKVFYKWNQSLSLNLSKQIV